LALWMESDRMGYLLPAVTAERFETQRDVVLNERRQSYENRPYGMASIALASALYSPSHPYSWPTIGTIADLQAMQLDEVHSFFRTYYHPANASLTIAGDIETERALDLAARYFGDLAAGPSPASITAEATLSSETRLVLEDRVELPRLYIAWHSPGTFKPGDAEMDLVGDLLASGKTSRLFKQLVYERRIALDVSAYQSGRELGGYFIVAATAAPGHPLSELAAVIDDQLQRVLDDGPSDHEMERGLAQAEAQFVYQLQTVGGFGGKSDQLNAYNVFLGQPGFFSKDLQRYRDATPESVKRAAASLALDRRVLLSVVPRGQLGLALDGSRPVSVS
jgi:zinc protease